MPCPLRRRRCAAAAAPVCCSPTYTSHISALAPQTDFSPLQCSQQEVGNDPLSTRRLRPTSRDVACTTASSLPCITPHPLPLHAPQELGNDPLGILRPASKLQHQLPLASAYAAVAAAPDADHGMQRQKRRLDPATGEPK